MLAVQQIPSRTKVEHQLLLLNKLLFLICIGDVSKPPSQPGQPAPGDAANNQQNPPKNPVSRAAFLSLIDIVKSVHQETYLLDTQYLESYVTYPSYITFT